MKLRLIMTFVLLLAAADTFGADPSIEAENYVSYNNTGGLNIQSSAGILFGLDVTGEWTEYNYSISSFGSRSAMMYARGTDGLNYHLRMTFTPEGEGDPVSVDFQFTGSGCG